MLWKRFFTEDQANSSRSFCIIIKRRFKQKKSPSSLGNYTLSISPLFDHISFKVLTARGTRFPPIIVKEVSATDECIKSSKTFEVDGVPPTVVKSTIQITLIIRIVSSSLKNGTVNNDDSMISMTPRFPFFFFEYTLRRVSI